MKCNYDTRTECTEQRKHINTCAWMKDKRRTESMQQGQKECDRIGEADRGTEKEKAAGE